MMHIAMEVSDALTAQGRSVTLVSTPTLKPLDLDGLAEVLGTHRQVVILEEHAPQGGLASQVKQLAWDGRVACDLRTYTLRDEFVHCYGSHADLLRRHGISVDLVMSDLNF
jgi:transketolase